MFLGHVGVALAAKRPAPEVSLGGLMVAANWLDLIWPLFLLLGWEQLRIDPGNTALTPLEFTYYPWTHGLLIVIGWAMLLGIPVGWRYRSLRVGSLIGALVASHWILDWIVHRPDLPLLPGASPLYGLGLWNSIPLSLTVEAAFFLGGVAVYVNATRPSDRWGVWGFWSMIALYSVIYLANTFGPPPPSADSVAWVGLLAWLFPIWAWWADSHRGLVSPRHTKLEEVTLG